jgi:aminoglycoside phosphotransferase (APT) family kinase protein
VWVHGDIAAGNLLMQEGRLSGVIDFGQLSIGDPACDLAITWMLFEGQSREIFRSMLPLDEGTWARARAWTLWKCLITVAAFMEFRIMNGSEPWRILETVLDDHKYKQGKQL